MDVIPDHIRQGLNVLFVGYNPSLRSGETGHHYANPNNRFYRLLAESGLTARRYRPEEDQQLLADYGYGFTNIVARPTRTAEEISPDEYAEGRILLKQKIEKHRPRLVCFVGKGVYEQYSGRKNVPWGAQENPVVSGTIEYVVPSSSGLVRIPMDEMIEHFRGIRTQLE
ncbi:mismatch-specific DNA-glycosylase [Paenibacillus turpanensis]|uniref:mismatch-specific DNA-glycosylase n=1 Tax=Paenibacillus turpanensis TaxID=2689078 RepID=UPI001409BD74|nr:mismatch-specific DNA-glycosylase [Paenibacillus turpanensis]